MAKEPIEESDPVIDAIIDNARKQASEQLIKQLAMAELNDNANSKRFFDPTNNFSPDEADITAEAEKRETERARAAKAASMAGATAESIAARSDFKEARRTELKEFLDRFKNERKVHQDLLDNPDAYGGVMLDGTTPIDADAEKQAISDITAAIAAVQEQIAGLN